MNRQSAIAVVLLLAGAGGFFAWYRAPVASTSLDCDGGVVRLGPDGVARCGPGAELPPGQAMTVGQRFDCNTATAEDLALVAGLGKATAAEIVARRPDGGFTNWDELDRIPGVGSARLIALQAVCELRAADGGVW